MCVCMCVCVCVLTNNVEYHCARCHKPSTTMCMWIGTILKCIDSHIKDKHMAKSITFKNDDTSKRNFFNISF
jgi:hypothetical protein